MPRWLRVTLVVVVLLIVAIGGAYWWYLGDGNPPANLPAYSFDIAAVRAKADELPGGKATDIRVETVATGNPPATFAVAGDGFNGAPIGAFSYQVIQSDITVPQVHKGVALVLGYHGILADVDRPLSPATELKLRIDLPLVNHRATDIYGRVKKTTRTTDRYLCGVEFTSLGNKTRSSIELLVQLLMQGVEPGGA